MSRPPRHVIAAGVPAWVLASSLTVLGVLIVVLTIAAGLIWYERRLLSLVQDRSAPTASARPGSLQVLADTFKILFKEDWVPPFADRACSSSRRRSCWSRRCCRSSSCRSPSGVVIADLNIGLLFVLAMSSLAVYSVVLAGWSSHSKYSLVGGLRAAAQMVSYEVFMGLSLVGVVIIAGSFSLQDIVESQRGRLVRRPAVRRLRGVRRSPAWPRRGASPSTSSRRRASWWPATTPSTRA